MPLIGVVGCGRVGVSAALQIALKGLGDIVLLDIVQGLPQGEALDLSHMASILGIDVEITGSNDYRDISGADLTVITAGVVRKADMTRMDLLQKNTAIVADVSAKVREYAPNSKVVVVTNPLDVMTYVALRKTGFERERVIGFSGLLDFGRFRYLVARELGVSRSSIVGPIIGEHGDSMVLLPRLTHVLGKPLTSLLPREKVGELIERTRKAGAEVISLKGWSASHAPGAGVALMAEAILKDTDAVIPSSVYLRGEYGVEGVCSVVPAVLGLSGVKRIIELDLDDSERREFLRSVEVVRQAQEAADKLLH
ncbi:MAG: malate dehydrogenase [Nitrososphaerota archaeon]